MWAVPPSPGVWPPLLVAYVTPGRRAAQLRAMVLLVTATVVYYGLVVVIGHRWRGATLADGSSALWVSLASVGRAVLLWLVGAILAGAVLGWLGEGIRSGSRHARAVSAGLAAGLLASQAVALAVRVRGLPTPDRLGWSLLISVCVTVLLVIAVPATMLGRANRAPSWWVYLITAVATTAWPPPPGPSSKPSAQRSSSCAAARVRYRQRAPGLDVSLALACD